jgi:ATP-dependent Clp protease protease subunit
VPRREGPLLVPIVDAPGDQDEEVRGRRLFLSGQLDTEAATRLAAELMALDGRSGDAVELVINSDGGPLVDVLIVLDVVTSMRAPVNTMCLGRARGTAAVVLACGTGTRRASAHAVISLRVDVDDRLIGPPGKVADQLAEMRAVSRRIVTILAAATGRDAASLEHDFDHGAPLERRAAIEQGLIDRA